MKLIAIILLIGCTCQLHAQSNPFMNDVNGRPIYLHTNYNAEGTPYLMEAFTNAHITVEGGKTYRDVQVRFNLMEPQVEYLDAQGKEMVSLLPVKKIIFPLLKTEDGILVNATYVAFSGALNAPGASIYQLLDSGKLSLLNRIVLTYKDEKKYGDASITRTFRKTETLYSIKSGTTAPERLDRSKSAIILLMNDQADAVNKFITANNINVKKEKDLVNLFNYYNSLNK